MGCSSSVIAPTHGEVKNNDMKDHLAREKLQSKNGHVKTPQSSPMKNISSDDIFTKKKIPNIDKNANKITASDQTPVPKSVAFDITLDGQSGDGLLLRKLPPRLKVLEPLDLPKLTAAQLEEKQRLADEKREKLRLKKINTSQKSSKRRRELLKAKEFGMTQQLEQEKTIIVDNLKQAELNRERKLLEIKEKQRLREERAKRARERAKSLQNAADEVEVEKDEEFNAGSEDSWLENGENNEEEESGLKKPIRPNRNTVSASTVDSYDLAFMKNSKPQLLSQETPDDDFFGS
ncbi:caldesmon [Biomphalaria glabrata]|nr:caldesmon-like [Biomphalaria glabrata]